VPKIHWSLATGRVLMARGAHHFASGALQIARRQWHGSAGRRILSVCHSTLANGRMPVEACSWQTTASIYNIHIKSQQSYIPSK